MTTMSANGRGQRKSLAGQLDRLDRVLDGLAEGLNEAVAHAVKDVVSVAVEAAVREVLTNAELLRRLRPDSQVRPGLLRTAAGMLCRGLVSAAKKGWNWATGLVGYCRNKATESVSALQQGHKALVVHVRRGMTAFARRVWFARFVAMGLLLRFRKPLLVALATGIMIGVGCYLAGPAVASTVSGLAGFAGSLLASLLSRLRRVLVRAELRAWSIGRLP
jgi:hypothetical protein